MVACRFVCSIADLFQRCRRLATDVSSGRCALLTVVACAFGNSEAFFRSGLTQWRGEWKRLPCCIVESPWNTTVAVYGNAFNQYGGILYGIPCCSAFKHCVIVVLSRYKSMDCYGYRRVLCNCGNNSRWVFVAETPGQTTITSRVVATHTGVSRHNQ